MNSGAPVALAIGVGYVLGRTHRLKWALILGTAAATGGLKGLPDQVMQRGTKVLQSTPELARLAENAQRLLDAGRGAAVSAMNSRMESMGESLQGRTKQLAGGLTGESDTEPEDRGSRRSGGDGGRGSEGGRGGRAAEPDEDEEEYEETDEYDEPEADEEPDDEEAAEPEEEEESSPAARRRGSTGSGRRPVVQKTGR
jgi:hypothetical protein